MRISDWSSDVCSSDLLVVISKLLKPRLAVPNQHIRMYMGRSRAMYIVASGAVTLHLPDNTAVELGTGEMFGEMALLTDTDFEARVTSLGYSRLLMLLEGDLDTLLDRDSLLRETIGRAHV